MVTIETLSIVFTGISISLAAFYYISTLRNAQRTQQLQLETRQTQIFMQIYQQLNSEKTHKTWVELVNLEISDYDDYLQKYDSSVNPDHFSKRAYIWYSLDAIGELLRQGIIEPDLLHRLSVGVWTIPMWEKWGDIIKEIRVRENIPDAWVGFEYLYDEMKRFRDSREYPEITYPQRN